MSLTQRYKVQWHENERVDLPDLLAIDTLRDGDIANIVKALILETEGLTPPANARVMKGFNFTQVAALTVQLTNEDCAAVDEKGMVLTRPQGSTVQLNMAPSTTNHVYAYLEESDDVQDARRFIDPTTQVETADTVPTRTGKFVNFYVSTAPITNTAVIGGQTRYLVLLLDVLTGAGSITTMTDRRALFGDPGTGETQAAAAALNLTSVRAWLTDICAKIKAISGQATYATPPTQNLLSLRTAFDVQHNTSTGAHEVVTATSVQASGGPAPASGQIAATGFQTNGAPAPSSGQVSAFTGQFVQGVVTQTAAPGNSSLKGYRGGQQVFGSGSTIRSSNNDGSVAYDALINEYLIIRLGAWVTIDFHIKFTFTGATGLVEFTLPYTPRDMGASGFEFRQIGWWWPTLAAGAVIHVPGTNRGRFYAFNFTFDGGGFVVGGGQFGLGVQNGVTQRVAGRLEFFTDDAF